MYHFIINPKSRSGRGIKIWTMVKHELDLLKVPYIYYFTKHQFHATSLAIEICEKYSGVKNIIVLGGDGTVNEVINGITDFSEVLLGYIPSGSSNDLARSLKLPKDPLTSLNHILTPTRFVYVDVGEIQKGDYKSKFAVSSGIGFDAAVCEESFRSRLKKFLNQYGFGKLTYLLITLKQLFTCRYLNGTVIIDGIYRHTYKDILLITSMIHRYEGGGIQINPKANPFDGKLSVCIIHGVYRPKIAVLLPTLFFGKHILFKGVKTYDCKSITIQLKENAFVHTDGEIPGKFNTLTITCLPKQMRIIK